MDVRDVPEGLRVAVGRRDVAERLASTPATKDALEADLDVSRSTVERALTDLQREGLATDSADGYVATQSVHLLLERYDRFRGEEFSPTEAETIARRREFLERLGDDPLHKADLIDDLETSRSTVDRAVDALQAAGLIERETGGYVLTDRGWTAARRYPEFLADVEAILSGRDVLNEVPVEWPLPTAVVSGGTPECLADRHRLFETLANALTGAERYRVVVPRPLASRHLRLCHARVLRGGLDVEVAASSDVLYRYREEYPHLAAELAEADSFAAYSVDAPPFALLLATEASSDGTAVDPATTTALLVSYDDRGPAGVVRLDEAVAVEWALDTFEDLRTAGSDETAELASAEAVADLSRLTGDRLPARLRTAGFVRVDDQFFENHDPVSPERAWRAGLGLPEVDAGYAVSRHPEDGATSEDRPIGDRVLDQLAAGTDVAVLGPPGSGKSTVCKRVACEWCRRFEGSVLYREGGHGQPLESSGTLEAVLDRTPGHALVVVEDAARPDASAVFEAMRSFGGREDVSFLVDSRETEWHDREAFPVDARLEAFRRDHVAVEHVPPIHEADCRRLLDRVEAVTGEAIDVSVAELLATARETEAVGDGEGTAGAGSMFLLFHRLARYVDPMGDRGEVAVPTALDEHVDRVRRDLAEMGETALSVGVLANLANAAGLDVDRAYLHAAALGEGGSHDDVRRALDRLEGDLLFPDAESGGAYRTLHDQWSVEFLARFLDARRTRAAADRFGDCLSRLLSLAEDGARQRVAAATGETPALGRIVVDPEEWVDEVLERTFALGRTRPKLAPLYDDGGRPVVDAHPQGSGRSAAVTHYSLGRMLLEGGFLDRAERAFENAPPAEEWHGARRHLGLSRVAHSRGNFEAAVETATEGIALVEGGDPDRSSDRLELRGRLLVAKARAEVESSEYDRTTDTLDRLRVLLERIDAPLLSADERRLRGRIARRRSEYDDAREHYRAALSIYRDLGDRHRAAAVAEDLGNVAEWRTNYDRARRHYRKAMEGYQSVGDRHGVANAAKNLGSLAQSESNFERARDYYEAAAEGYRTVGDDHGLAKAQANLGTLESQLGRYDRARDQYRTAMAKFEAAGDRHSVAKTDVALANVAKHLGDIEGARENFRDALTAFEDLGDPHSAAKARLGLAQLAVGAGRYDAAEDYVRAALDAFEEFDDDHETARCYQHLGIVERDRGNYEQAREYLDAAMERFRSVGARADVAYVRSSLGRLARASGDYDRAREQFREALADYESIDDHSSAATARRHLGTVAAARGNYERAHEEFRTATDLLGELDDDRKTALVQSDAARVALARGNYERALERSRSAAETLRDLELHTGVARALTTIGVVARRRGDFGLARERFEAALAALESTDVERGRPRIEAELGTLALERERFETAADHLDRALATAREVSNRHWVGRIELRRAKLGRRRGTPDAARRHLDDARSILEDLGDEHGLARVDLVAGRLAADRDDHEAARRRLRSAVDRLASIGAVPDALDGLETLVAVCDDDGDHEAVLQWCRRAEELPSDGADPLLEEKANWFADRRRAIESEAPGND